MPDYSALYVRSSDQYISDPIEHTSLTGDFTFEFWWKPTTLNAAEDQTFYQVNHSLGGTPVRIWKTDNAGSPRLRLRCQEVGGAAPAAAEHVEVEWDISAVVSVSTWAHIAVTFDVSQAVATIAELYVDTVSQGNGTVISGTDCSSIIVGDAQQYIGSDGAGNAVDGQLFDWRMWILSVRTSTEISNNYQTVQRFSNSGQMRHNLYKGGAHHYNAAGQISTVLFGNENNGPIAFSADIPANIEHEEGSAGAAIVTGVMDLSPYSGLFEYVAGAEFHALEGDAQDFKYYTSDFWFAAEANLVDLSGSSQAPAFIYRMRAIDNGLGRTVYWTTEQIDPLGDSYTGPGPLTDVVVSAVICQR